MEAKIKNMGCLLTSKPYSVIICLLIMVTFFLIAFAALTVKLLNPTAGITPEVLSKVEKKYGELSKNRLKSWIKFIDENKQLTLDEKLKQTNDFFNNPLRIRYNSDMNQWGKSDYWATPVEFIIQGSGDCEDYAVAKFFTLVALGVPQENMELTYVYLKQQAANANPNQAHLVLAYYATKRSEPLILDNVDSEVKLASQRPDLKPVFSFNGIGLWSAKQREQGETTSAEKFKPWSEMNQRSFAKLGL